VCGLQELCVGGRGDGRACMHARLGERMPLATCQCGIPVTNVAHACVLDVHARARAHPGARAWRDAPQEGDDAGGGF